MAQSASLPHWDVSGLFPSPQSPAFEEAVRTFLEALTEAERRFDALGVMAREQSLPADTETVRTAEAALTRLNALQAEYHRLRAYLTAFTATNSRDEIAQAQVSRLQKEGIRLHQLETRFTAWIGAVDVEALIAASPLCADHAFSLRKRALAARHLMSPQEEALAAALHPTGGEAWRKLYGNFTSQITVEVPLPEGTRRLPMTAVRNLAHHPDREVRRIAYEAELAAWEANAVPIAAALNSIKGEQALLARRRGWDSPLDLALFNNNIDRETLQVMMTQAKENFPHFRRYLHIKARLLGLERLAWYDLFAPVGREGKPLSFEEARDFILEQFASFSPRLLEMGRRAFAEHWIDAEPREGKRGGAFCMWLHDEESRILANYQPSFRGMGTLAHELGHAYHNYVRAGLTYHQRLTPMTLAETASIFSETLVRQAALKQATQEEQKAILDASLQGATQVIVDITSRFLFEQRLFAAREERELTLSELKHLMLESQRETYGDGLDGEHLHPWMWAAKVHYYGSIFYNFPYMFGILFARGLYARYEAEGEAFLSAYDDLLASTGRDGAAELAARFGIDLHAPDFWQSALDTLIAEIDRLEALAA